MKPTTAAASTAPAPGAAPPSAGATAARRPTGAAHMPTGHFAAVLSEALGRGGAEAAPGHQPARKPRRQAPSASRRPERGRPVGGNAAAPGGAPGAGGGVSPQPSPGTSEAGTSEQSVPGNPLAPASGRGPAPERSQPEPAGGARPAQAAGEEGPVAGKPATTAGGAPSQPGEPSPARIPAASDAQGHAGAPGSGGAPGVTMADQADPPGKGASPPPLGSPSQAAAPAAHPGGAVVDASPHAPARRGPTGQAEAPAPTAASRGQAPGRPARSATVAPVPSGETSGAGAPGAAPASATPPAATTAPWTPASSNPTPAGAAVAERLVAAMGSAARDQGGSWSTSVALSPPELGQVEATVVARQGIISVHLVAETPAGFAALVGSRGDIGSTLGTNGANVTVAGPGWDGGGAQHQAAAGGGGARSDQSSPRSPQAPVQHRDTSAPTQPEPVPEQYGLYLRV